MQRYDRLSKQMDDLVKEANSEIDLMQRRIHGKIIRMVHKDQALDAR